MPCSRCGQNRPSRPVPAPSGVGRSGAGSINPAHPVNNTGNASSGLPNNIIKSAITGLKYVPNK